MSSHVFLKISAGISTGSVNLFKNTGTLNSHWIGPDEVWHWTLRDGELVMISFNIIIIMISGVVPSGFIFIGEIATSRLSKFWDNLAWTSLIAPTLETNEIYILSRNFMT